MSKPIHAVVEKKGRTFEATSPDFPGVIGRGKTEEKANEALISQLEKYRLKAGSLEAHPLCTKILEWFNTASEPVFKFRSPEEFDEFLMTIDCEETIKYHVCKNYQDTAILASALVGGDYNEDVHHIIYKASESPLGFALTVAAALAFESKVIFPSFAKSTRLPGFVDALEAWANRNELLKPFDGQAELKYIHRNIVRPNSPFARFWQNACQDSFDNINAFNSALAKEHEATNAAERNTKQRRDQGVRKREAAFLDIIKVLWVPGALWCMSDSEIVATIAPEKRDGMVEAYAMVQRNISYLNYTKSRKRPQI